MGQPYILYVVVDQGFKDDVASTARRKKFKSVSEYIRQVLRDDMKNDRI